MDHEKRTVARVGVSFPANCVKSSEECYPREYLPSIAKDLSREGAHLVASPEFKVGERVTLVLEIPHYFLPLLVYGEIKWMREAEGYLEAGVKFAAMSPADLRKLDEFISINNLQGVCSG